MSDVATLFLDTNILVYARDRSEPVKGPAAQSLLQQIFQAGQPLLSVQVLAEFYWTVTRKLPLPLTAAEASAEVRRMFLLASVVPLTKQVFETALDDMAWHGLPLWDAQILAAAALNRATTILSEDFQHRNTISGVTFVNPFAPDFDPAEILGP